MTSHWICNAAHYQVWRLRGLPFVTVMKAADFPNRDDRLVDVAETGLGSDASFASPRCVRLR